MNDRRLKVIILQLQRMIMTANAPQINNGHLFNKETAKVLLKEFELIIMEEK